MEYEQVIVAQAIKIAELERSLAITEKSSNDWWGLYKATKDRVAELEGGTCTK